MLLLVTLAACDQQVNSQNHSGKAKTIEKKAYIKGDALPIETETLDIPLINQMDHPRLYNGCEVASLAMILNYHGLDVTKNELADKVERVPLTYDNDLKGNQNNGLIGDIKDGPGLSIYHCSMHELADE